MFVYTLFERQIRSTKKVSSKIGLSLLDSMIFEYLDMILY